MRRKRNKRPFAKWLHCTLRQFANLYFYLIWYLYVICISICSCSLHLYTAGHTKDSGLHAWGSVLDRGFGSFSLSSTSFSSHSSQISPSSLSRLLMAKLWQLKETYGNLWQFMADYGNLRKLKPTLGNLWSSWIDDLTKLVLIFAYLFGERANLADFKRGINLFDLADASWLPAGR